MKSYNDKELIYKRKLNDFLKNIHKYRPNPEAVVEQSLNKQSYKLIRNFINGLDKQRSFYFSVKNFIIENSILFECSCGKIVCYNESKIDIKRKEKRVNFVKCKECDKEYRKDWYESRGREYVKEYNKSEKYLSYQYKYVKKRRTKDSLFRLSGDIRGLINQSIRNKGYTKKSRTHSILGISFKGFQEHIEKQFTEGMSWDNRSDWHLDHIIPVASANNEEEMHLLNHHLNFQPLWAEHNLYKSDNYNEEGKQAMLQRIIKHIENKVIK